ncbi:MAG: tetratricopeptide repeat protein, partial [Myxococcales bacterium]|nr:tetratricopeptide repeat protein [Myxococcales bacterium]
KYPAAVVEFQLAYQAHPEAPNVRQWLARSLVAAGRVDEAMPHLEALSTALPDQAIVWVDLADGLAGQGKLDGDDGALARIDKALTLDAKLAAAHLRKIAILADAKRCKPARKALKDFKSIEPPAAAIELAQGSLAACK